MVSVNTVYRTVLLILNKEQRGYLTPDEFNKTATQVQLEIFNEYFEDLNQQLRVPENDNEFANRVKNLEEKISPFLSTSNALPYSAGSFSVANIPNFYKIGTVIYNEEKEVQYVQPNELLELNLSPLTKPSTYWPVYDYRWPLIYVYPKTIQSGLTCTYIRQPADPLWNFTSSPPSYQYVFNPSTYDPVSNPAGSTNFELHPTEQVNIITRILLYSGVIIKDPQVVQLAAQQVQSESINSKS